MLNRVFILIYIELVAGNDGPGRFVISGLGELDECARHTRGEGLVRGAEFILDKVFRTQDVVHTKAKVFVKLVVLVNVFCAHDRLMEI